MFNEMPVEVLVVILVFLRRMDLDCMQLVSRKLNRLIRRYEVDRSWVQLARHTAILNIRAPNYKPRIELKERRVYSYLYWTDVVGLLRKVRVDTVNVRALNGPFQLTTGEWMRYIRKVRSLRKVFNRAIVNFAHVPLCPRIGRAFMQQFLNASEIRFPHAMAWFSMPDDFSNEIYDIILPKVTQLFVSQVLTPSADVYAWLRLSRPEGMRRITIARGNHQALTLLRDMLTYFRDCNERPDHAMCVVVDHPHYLWDINWYAESVLNSMDRHHFCNRRAGACCYIRTRVLQPFLLILPGHHYDVPTKRQMHWRRLTDLTWNGAF